MFSGNTSHARPFLVEPAYNTPGWARDRINAVHPGWM